MLSMELMDMADMVLDMATLPLAKVMVFDMPLCKEINPLMLSQKLMMLMMLLSMDLMDMVLDDVLTLWIWCWPKMISKNKYNM